MSLNLTLLKKTVSKKSFSCAVLSIISSSLIFVGSAAAQSSQLLESPNSSQFSATGAALGIAPSTLNQLAAAAVAACYGNFTATATEHDNVGSMTLNTTYTMTYGFTFPTNAYGFNKVKSISYFWRKSTDAISVAKAINTLPGYISATTSGINTYTGGGVVKWKPTTALHRGIYYIYAKFVTSRGDMNTRIYKITVS